MSNLARTGVVYSFRAACAALLLVWPTAAAAQVGHPPESSPYRDVRAKWLLSATGGYSWGSGGQVGVGPHDGPLMGARVDWLIGGPAMLGFSATYGNLQRNLIDPEAPLDERFLGTAPNSVFMLESSIGLVLTGAKTWRGFAPYFGGTLGLAFGGDVPEDSLSGFEFNTKFTAGFIVGTRWHLGSRIALRFEFRDVFWQLKYPPPFFFPTEDVPPTLNPLTTGESEWTANPQVLISVGYAIRMK